MEIQELKLSNENNCLSCEAFIKINVAPGTQLTENSFDRVYLIRNAEKEFYVKLVDILKVEFGKVSSIMSLPATGLESHEWRRLWKERKPGITDETMMAVYYYKKWKIL